MSLLWFLAVAAGGAVAALALRRRRRTGTLVGVLAVSAALVAVAVAEPGPPLQLGGGALALTPYARVLLGVGLASGLLVLVVSRLASWEAAAPTVLLVAATGTGLALGVAGTPAAILVAGAASIAAAAVALARPASPARIRALARELRGTTLALLVVLIAVGLLSEEIGGLAVQPQVAGLAAVAAGLTLVQRFGGIPFHAQPVRLPDVAPLGALPALLALLPAAWAVILLEWGPATLGPARPLLGWDGTLLVLAGLATLALGTVAALIQDDLLRIAVYTVAIDAGVVVLGFASFEPGGRDALRAWLVAFVASRAALVGWAIAFRAAFGTLRLSEARGWLRRAPALGLSLVGIAVAAVGWPGIMVWDARLAVLHEATAGLGLQLASLASLGTVVALARVLGGGLGRPEARVTAAPGELARVPAGLRAAARALGTPGGRRPSTLRAALREARPLLELNRTPLRALIVVLLAGFALLAAAGGFGTREAAASPGIPIPVATGAPPELVPTEPSPGEPSPAAEPSPIEQAPPGATQPAGRAAPQRTPVGPRPSGTHVAHVVPRGMPVGGEAPAPWRLPAAVAQAPGPSTQRSTSRS